MRACGRSRGEVGLEDVAGVDGEVGGDEGEEVPWDGDNGVLEEAEGFKFAEDGVLAGGGDGEEENFREGDGLGDGGGYADGGEAVDNAGDSEATFFDYVACVSEVGWVQVDQDVVASALEIGGEGEANGPGADDGHGELRSGLHVAGKIRRDNGNSGAARSACCSRAQDSRG